MSSRAIMRATLRSGGNERDKRYNEASVTLANLRH
jgi:hypothetical protein